MCSVLDDVCGHAAFVLGDGVGSWGGCTVQVNCSLKKPVKVGAILKVWGRIKERKGRKFVIEGALVGEDGSVHATLEGIAVQCTRAQILGSAETAPANRAIEDKSS